MSADLHFHSTHSDGSDSPTDLARAAAKLNLGHVALTDHDSVAGIQEFQDALGPSQTGIPGVEISVQRSEGTLHVLLYGPGVFAPTFVETLRHLADARATRNVDIIERARNIGLDITIEEVLTQAGTNDPLSKSVGRPHIAAVLVSHGYASDISEAFNHYLAKGQPLYRPRPLLSLASTTQLIHEHALAAVIAHPHTLKLIGSDLDDFVATLSSAGFSGLEAYYGSYSPSLRGDLATLAHKHGLIATGGSDYHGLYKPELKLGTGNGDLAVPDAAGEALIERLATLESTK